MSTEEAAGADEICANCGTAAVDDVKLKKCACNLIKYCSIACQKNHRPQHKKLCRKRLAELRDVNLFTQPDESHLGECPICCLSLPIDLTKSIMMPCCCKIICNGCHFANQMQEILGGLKQRCAFCREPASDTEEEINQRIMKRIKENNDPVALRSMGKKHYYNVGNYDTALEYFTKAVELGDADAHCQLGYMYEKGEGVKKDKKKAIYHYEEAAIGGHVIARYNLGVFELKNDRYERAKKHWIIAANLGFQDSLEWLKNLYEGGEASKEDYAGALRAYQAAVEAANSSDREKAEEVIKSGKNVRNIG